MSTQWISFQQPVHNVIGTLLLQAGFQLVFSEGTETSDVMLYERVGSTTTTQRISFDGLLWRDDTVTPASFNWLRVLVTSPDAGTPTYLRQFAPQEAPRSVYESQGWLYTSEGELLRAIDEIRMILIKHVLS